MSVDGYPVNYGQYELDMRNPDPSVYETTNPQPGTQVGPTPAGTTLSIYDMMCYDASASKAVEERLEGEMIHSNGLESLAAPTFEFKVLPPLSY